MQDPPAGHVRIRVEACGICHSDFATVDAVFPVEFPRVPGHEIVARATALATIPGGLEPADAAPLCAGLTTFNSLRNSGARPGDLVAVLGIGGLGTWPSSTPAAPACGS